MRPIVLLEAPTTANPVFAATNDGGESWALDPLPSVVGHLDTLSCPSKDFCAGLAAKSSLLSEGTTDATFLFTTDGGKTFTDEPLVRGDSMQSLSCSSDQDCTAIGSSDHLGGPDNFAAGVSARTTDGGATWSPGTIPDGLGVDGGLGAVVCRRAALLDDWAHRDSISEPAPMRWDTHSGTAGDHHADDKCAKPRRRGSCPGRVRCDSEGVPKGGRIASGRL